MDKKYEDLIVSKITSFSGILITKIHIQSIVNYVEKQLVDLNIDIAEYCSSLVPDSQIFNDLLNQVTTNETYFFREQKQFEYLEKYVFPKFKYRKMVIWSAASSTGEESLSLLAMALSFNIDATIYATDIDDNVIKFFKTGIYSKYSLRPDGQKYHHLLYNYGHFNEENTAFIFNEDFINRIQIFKYNLVSDNQVPFSTKVDLVLMRNVFIYFDREMRRKVTEKVCNCLNNNGLLFYSINEVCSIDQKIVPSSMHKVNYNQVYFFVKGDLTSVPYEITKVDPADNEKEPVIKPEKKVSDDRPADDPVKTYSLLKKALEKADFSEAGFITENFKPEFNKKYYSSFYKAIVKEAEQNFIDAEHLYSTCEFVKGEFWPCYYFHGMMNVRTNNLEKAAISLEKCKQILQSEPIIKFEDCKFLFPGLTLSSILSNCTKNLPVGGSLVEN